MNQIAVVKLLSAEVITVLARSQITGFNSISIQKLLICHTKRLTNSLCNDLSLKQTQISISICDRIYKMSWDKK